MTDRLKVEEARQGSTLVGWRLTIGDAFPLLVFADQQAMPGYRHGDAFADTAGRPIAYWPVPLLGIRSWAAAPRLGGALNTASPPILYGNEPGEQP